VSAWKIGAFTLCAAAHSATRGMRLSDSKRNLPRRLLQRFACRERGSQHDLGPPWLFDGREQVTVARETEERPLVAARGRRDAPSLLNPTRDQGGHEPGADPCGLGVADTDHQTADEGARPLEPAQVIGFVDSQGRRDEGLRHRASNLGVGRAHDHERRTPGRKIVGHERAADCADASHGGLLSDDVADGRHRVLREAADCVHDEMPAVEKVPEGERDLGDRLRWHCEQHEPSDVGDLAIVLRR